MANKAKTKCRGAERSSDGGVKAGIVIIFSIKAKTQNDAHGFDSNVSSGSESSSPFSTVFFLHAPLKNRLPVVLLHCPPFRSPVISQSQKWWVCLASWRYPVCCSVIPDWLGYKGENSSGQQNPCFIILQKFEIFSGRIMDASVQLLNVSL